MTSLGVRVRAALMPTHERIEALPLAAAVARGTVAREAYGALLRELRAIHDALETALATFPEVAALATPETARAAVCARDLAALGLDAGVAHGARTEAGRALVDRIRGWATDAPWRLVGALYVLEGSRMGSSMLVDALAKGFDVTAEPGKGLDYHLDGAAERPRLWRAWKRRLDEQCVAADDQAAVVAAAVATMDGLYGVYAEAGG